MDHGPAPAPALETFCTFYDCYDDFGIERICTIFRLALVMSEHSGRSRRYLVRLGARSALFHFISSDFSYLELYNPSTSPGLSIFQKLSLAYKSHAMDIITLDIKLRTFSWFPVPRPVSGAHRASALFITV